MKPRIFIICIVLVLLSSMAFAEDLTIDYQVDVSGATKTSYFSFKGPIRYMEADKDHYDGVSGASLKKSTEMFQPYRYDVKGKNALPDSLRGLFLFGVAGGDQAKTDNLTVVKANNGEITIQYVHRGRAYRLVTDKSGFLNFPDGEFTKRDVGFIESGKPQVISKDFSSNGQAGGVNWNKVWNAGIADGKAVVSGSKKKTGKIVKDNASSDSMYYWKGKLKVDYNRNILKITGGLDAVKR